MQKEFEKNESNNNLIHFTINKDIQKYLNSENLVSFQQAFSLLRKKMLIKPTRKAYIDSILKKCKVRFFKAINDCLKKCLKINIKKFPQKFLTNISIEKNRDLLEITVQELYKNFNACNINLEECIELNLCFKGKEKYLKYICHSKISDLYLLYIESMKYKKEIDIIKKYIGIKMFYLYIFVSENYINYYLFSKPHFCKNNNAKKIYNEKVVVEESQKSTISFSFDKSENTNEFI